MKIFGVILTFNCENLIEKTIKEIPQNKFHKIICSDDGSTDNTKKKCLENKIDFFSHEHSGYGGNLIFGLKKAFEMGATHVVEIHGDGQYDLKNIDEFFEKLKIEEPDLILGNRFYDYKKTLENGMPLHIFVGNIVLSFIARKGLSLDLTDLFPGQRAYSNNFYEIIKLFNLPQGYQLSFEIIMLSKLHNLKISSINCDCNYKGEKKTAPLVYVFSCLFHLISSIFFYRFNKQKIYNRKKFK